MQASLDSREFARFSALQRAEIAEIPWGSAGRYQFVRFSALQRAEIAEIQIVDTSAVVRRCFSALQRAEIAEINDRSAPAQTGTAFQCSSTSRNC